MLDNKDKDRLFGCLADQKKQLVMQRSIFFFFLESFDLLACYATTAVFKYPTWKPIVLAFYLSP